tara:strand:+ start:156 stop:620 length:465 start_codon:yes stop_codon:yes gene_type:complete
MFSEIVKISSVGSENLTIQPLKNGSCSGCSLKSSCGLYFLNSLYVNREIVLPTTLVQGNADAQSWIKGSLVHINIEASKLVELALILYFLPLLGMLLTVFLADLAGFNEIVIMVLVVISLLLSMKILKQYFRSHGSLEKITISLLSKSRVKLST